MTARRGVEGGSSLKRHIVTATQEIFILPQGFYFCNGFTENFRKLLAFKDGTLFGIVTQEQHRVRPRVLIYEHHHFRHG